MSNPQSFPEQSNTIKPDEMNRYIRQLIVHQQLDKAAKICYVAVQKGYATKETYIFYILFLIRQNEIEKNEPQTFNLSNNPDVLINHYHTLKFLIRRQEFPQMELLQSELYSYCRELNISEISLEIIARFSTTQPDQIMEKILKGLNSHE